MAKKDKSQPSYVENISVEPMDTIMDSRSAMYAKEVIQDRAIPDLRDGLKPVQRRIYILCIEMVIHSINSQENALVLLVMLWVFIILMAIHQYMKRLLECRKIGRCVNL